VLTAVWQYGGSVFNSSLLFDSRLLDKPLIIGNHRIDKNHQEMEGH
jgi:hypothetical protein